MAISDRFLALLGRASPAPPPASEEVAPYPPDPVLDAIAAPVLIVSQGVVTSANAAARALLGPFIVGEDARVALRHPAATERLAREGDEAGDPVELADLGERGRRWSMRVGRTPDGRRVVQLLDQSEAHAAERMRVDFVANASHELRTPLASVIGYVETLRDLGEGEPALQARFLGVIHDEARRMQQLVEDLISLSRIEAEKFRAPEAIVDLALLAADVAAELRDAPGGARIVTELPDAPALVTGDRPQLSQLLHNLIGNALKYGRAEAPVTVTLRPETQEWRLAVEDEGEGIAPEHLPRLTERFYRVNPGRSRAAGGTGLGLAIVKHIVEHHRGRLEVASTPGIGTVVAVRLPAAPDVSQNRNSGSA